MSLPPDLTDPGSDLQRQYVVDGRQADQSFGHSYALPTPIAGPANSMAMEPGDHRFGDYWKLGGVLFVWYFVVGVGIVPLIWSL